MKGFEKVKARRDATGSRPVDAAKKKFLLTGRVYASTRLRVSFFFIGCALLLLSFGLKRSPAQKPSDDAQAARPNNLHQWGAVTLFHGLPSDRVRAIAQTSDGVMWFGTDNGLARYDGRRIESVVAEGLKNARVLALRVDAEGSLWIGTENGAARLVGAEFRAIPETEGKAVAAIMTMERGRAVLATSEGLLFDCRLGSDGALTVRTMMEEPLTGAEANSSSALPLTSLASERDALLVGTRSRGLLTIGPEGVTRIESRPPAYFIETLERDSQGTLWMGARAKAEESGLYHARESLRPVKVGDKLGTISALGADKEGGVWVGTDGRGVFHFIDEELRERFTFENSSGGLRSNTIYSIFVDREQVVWFGTDRGVCRFDPQALRVETLGEELESNFVRVLFKASDGRLICGTTRGLFISDTTNPAWRPVEKFSRSTVYAIAEDGAGRLLIGTSNGLYGSVGTLREVGLDSEFVPVEGETIEGSTTDSLRAIAQFQDKTFVASFGRGVERVEGLRRTLVWPAANADATAREVVSLFAEGNQRLWISTAHGEVLHFDGREVVPARGLESFVKTSTVWDIKQSADGLVWIASASGLYTLKGRELKSIVPGVVARSLMITDDVGGAHAAWCATAGGGLVRVLITDSFGPVVSRLDVEQGLPSQNVFALLRLPEKSGSEDLLVGTSRGLVRYAVGHIEPTFTGVRVTSSRVHAAEELRNNLRLEYPQNSLVLDVAATSSRTFPEQFQYAFLLYDREGHLIRQKLSRESQFTIEALRPGSYRVEVRAFNADLLQSKPLSFEFSVGGAPFPWTTAALAVLLALSLLALSWGYFQNRRIARTSSALMEANRSLADARLEVANQTERERRRIARDLHDQTLADLRNLILLTDELPSNGAGTGGQTKLDPATFRAEIEAVSTEIRRICEDLSPSVLENVGLSAALEWALSNSVAHAPANCRFEYEFKCVEDLEERIHLAPGERMQIYRIAQEAINNVCRHSGATRVRLEVSVTDEGSFTLKLKDDGRNFDPQEGTLKVGRGLANIRARASLIDAEVSWTSRAEGGTIFTLQKPGHAVEQNS